MLATLLALSLLAAPKTWTVSGTDVTWTMSATDLRATQGGTTIYALSDLKKTFDASLAGITSGEADSSNWEASESHEVLSVVGTLLSRNDASDGFTGGAHPYTGSLYGVMDVAHPKHPVVLTDYFPESEVVDALRADPFIKKHVGDADHFKQARTLSALLDALAGTEDCVGFRSEAWGAFAFHHLEGDRVAVRLTFSYDNEACRGQVFVVGVLLKIPASLQGALTKAASQQEGFLMKDAKEVHAPSVKYDWSAADDAPPKHPAK